MNGAILCFDSRDISNERRFKCVSNEGEFQMDLAIIAAREYIARQKGRSEPRGGFADPLKTSGKYWYPAESEYCKCCDKIQGESLPGTRGNTLKEHCLSLTHVARLYHVSPARVSAVVVAICRLEGIRVWFMEG